MGTIKNFIEKIKSARYGKDVRQSIVDAIEQTYSDAISNGHTDMEVAKARDTYNDLNSRLEADKNQMGKKIENEEANRKEALENMQKQVNGLASGSPKGTFETKSALETANPETGVYVVTSDGHIYSWAKNGSNAIDLGIYQATKIADNSIDIKKIDNNLKESLNLKCEEVILNSKNGEGIDKYLQPIINENYSLTDVFAIEQHETITFEATTLYDQQSLLTRTNQDGTENLEMLVQGESEENAKTYSYKNNTSNIIYARITYRTSKGLDNVYKYKQVSIDNEHLSDESVSLSKLSGDLKNFLNIKNEKLNLSSTSGNNIDKYGKFDTSANYSLTEVFEIGIGENLKFDATVFYEQQSLLASTNREGDEVKEILIFGETDQNVKTYSYKNNTSNIIYARITYRTSEGLNNVCISKSAITSTDVNKIVQETIEEQQEEDILLKKIIRDAGNVAIFNKIACIGDSLTHGDFESTEGSGENVPNLSTPAQMQKIIGNTVFNMGISGYCANRETQSMSWFDSAVERNWFSDEYKAEAYIIALGVNDTWRVENGFTGDVSLDIDTENYNNNSLNSVGGYATIIQKIKEIQPRAKIFCMTIPTTAGNETYRDDANTKIKAIANLFNCYILDMNTYYVKNDEVYDWNARYKLGGHLNAMGYKEYANVAITYIDWIIRNNYEDFKDVQFIGTDLYYNI